jgi:SAM-dependent methyltransferase/acyl carrier protein
VLEIGCGTGLLLFGIAPRVQRYVGIDGASSALERIGRQLDRIPLPQVALMQGFAHDVRARVDESFDTIIINSVAQYFPDADYLVGVIADAMSMLTPDGALYLGDLRGREQLPLFAAAVELARSSDDAAVADLAERAARRVEQDEELVVDPALFGAIAATMPELGSWSIRLKPGRFDNEMTQFRYDVVLRRSRDEAADQGDIVELDAESVLTASLREVLDAHPAIVRVLGFPNARLVREAALCHVLESEPHGGTVQAVRARVASVPDGIHPDDFLDFDARYTTEITWSARGVDRFDVVLRSTTKPSADPRAAVVAQPWSAYTNDPSSHSSVGLGPELRTHLRASLPDYMVPTAFVLLDALPRTPNGKIDRAQLPAPDRARTEGAAAAAPPENDFERTIAAVWQDMLSLDVVGVETNLFDLGANSLMMVQATSRISEALDRKISLVEMFRFPTVRSLAAHLDVGDVEEAAAMKESHDRGQSRREAMLRRRDTRRGR